MSPLDIIREEARARRTVIVDAFEKDGSRESREIEPYSIRRGRAGDRLVFFCLKRIDWRSLLIKNIVAASPTGRLFTPRYPVEL